MSTSQRLVRYLKSYWWQCMLGLLTMFAVTGVQLLYPYILGKGFIDKVLDAKQNQVSNLNYIVLGMAVLVLCKGFLTFLQNFLTSYVGMRVITDLRNITYRHLQKLSIAYHESHRVGEIIARLTNDIGIIQGSISRSLIDLIYQIILLIGTLVAIFTLNWKLALLTIITFPAVFLVVGIAGGKIRTISGHIQARIADITTILQETLTGIRVVKAFAMEEHEIKRFAKENESSYMVSMRSAKIMAVLNPLVEILFIIGIALVVWYGGREVINGNLTKGALVSFFGYISLAIAPITSMAGNLNGIQQALAAADRVFEVLDQEADVKDEPNAITLPRINGKVEFQNVSFGYQPQQMVLKKVNFTANPGEIIALVGPSGAGKTSLISLIARFYDPLEGQIKIDDYNIAKVQSNSLRVQIGLVPQESMLFGMSVRDNIAYGSLTKTQSEIEEAAKAANAHDFIMGLSEGYDTIIGERGSSLSGGQRQRIAIARALLRNPRILILDEATSALDNESEKLIQEALDRLMRDRTTFIIAHRLSTIQHASKIIVLDDGKIVQEGTHNGLLAKGGLYKKLYDMGTEIVK